MSSLCFNLIHTDTQTETQNNSKQKFSKNSLNVPSLFKKESLARTFHHWLAISAFATSIWPQSLYHVSDLLSFPPQPRVTEAKLVQCKTGLDGLLGRQQLLP